MKVSEVYTALIKRCGEDYCVHVPSWGIYTQGETLFIAIGMARDAITTMGLEYREEGMEFPDNKHGISKKGFDFITLVDVEF